MKIVQSVLVGAAAVVLPLASVAVHAAQAASDKAMIDRGRYVAKIAGCNDCHTAGYAQSGGKVPEREWLTGDTLGWRGPWGTTYPSNLRLYLADISEDEWVRRAKSLTTRPPMPWFALHDMTTQDLRAFYRFVRTLGPPGTPAPAYVPPDREPSGPVITFPAKPK